MRYRLVIFDFDGTLADTFPAFRVALARAIEAFDLRRVEESEIPQLRRMSAQEVIRHLRLPMWKVPKVGRYVRSAMAAQPPRLFSGTEETLRTLRQRGVELAVVSSNSETNVRAGLGPELAALFRTFQCGASLFGKASKFRQVLRRLDCPAGAALAVGDELRDGEAARSAGIDFAAVAWGFSAPEAFQRVECAARLQVPADLLEVVAGAEPQ